MKIKTDNKWKPFLCGSDLTPSELTYFDYLDEEERISSNQYLRYRGFVYHVSEFMAVGSEFNDPKSVFKDWDGYASDSMFSGVLIKISKDNDSYKIGRYYE